MKILSEILNLLYHQEEENQDLPYDDSRSADFTNLFQNQIVNYWEFIKFLPLDELWINILLFFHIVCFSIIIATRNYHNIQYALFFILLILVAMSERLNEAAAENWKLYSKGNYFDSNGFFISTVFSAPILFNCVVFIFLWLRSAINTMVVIKRTRVIEESRKQKLNTDKETKKGK